MARSRNIKPAFFLNEDLAELDPIERLAFVGLWTISDYKGCLEYRPKRIKATILPYDDCDIEKIMINLEQSRFIATYNMQGFDYIKIINFEKHQNPHPNEKKAGSKIPDMVNGHTYPIDNKEVVTNHDKDVTSREQDATNRADSLLLIPDSLEKGKPKKRGFSPPTLQEVEQYCQERKNSVDPETFIDFYTANGWVQSGNKKIKDWQACIRTWEKRERTAEPKSFQKGKFDGSDAKPGETWDAYQRRKQMEVR